MKKLIYLGLGLILMSCSGQPHMKPELVYPEMISPIYFLDTFRIEKPVVAYIDSEPYITSESIIKDSLDKDKLLEQKGVIRYLTQNLASNKAWDYVKIYNNTRKTNNRSLYSLQYVNEVIFIEDNLVFLDSLKGVALYRFDLEPQNFLLTLITKKDSLLVGFSSSGGNLANDAIMGVEYSNDYMLALAPLYSKAIRKLLNQRYLDKHP